ncbi:MAG: SDR family NAD(P)-dependent oxidoreductase [Xenococcaceae cyanobacterium MO_188.B32]|nr:SDR family NAD(P)-dependent oxidoreductase [Xenococcaceae cyanobacterium MO_188.B32]
MDLGLTGKTVLVTGSGRGIGLAVAKVLHQEGCYVALNARHETEIANIAANWVERVSFHVADVTQPQECQLLIDAVERKWGGLDLLVCNVGSGASVPPGQESLEEWHRVINLNLFATTNMVETARKLLVASGGAIVCISSICGLETLGAPVTYSAAKSALNSYVKGIARPLAKQGIRINAIAPGNILAVGGTWERKLKENPVAVETMLEREVALKRLGKPEEIANFAAFLVSSKASFATGAVFVVDGGQVRS